MSPSEIRDALMELDAAPLQSLGQNFLHDANLAGKIVSSLCPEPGDTVVEVGPGLGALTGVLTGSVERLILVEKDRKMVQWLRRRFGTVRGVEILEMDALDFDPTRLWGAARVRVIGNLPYYISTPLIAKFTAGSSPADLLVFLLQREVGERLAAGPGRKEFGAMSVRVQRHWEVELVRRVPPSAFFPPPKVDSVIVRMRRRKQRVPLDEEIFQDLVRRGFASRRKQLQSQLGELKPCWQEICNHLGVAPTVRAENLTLHNWERLTQLVSPPMAQKGDELFDEVDEDDRVLGPRPREEIHRLDLRHRAVHILLFDSRGRLFLQKRSPWKDRNPSLWDSSAAGHVDAGEDYPEAAVRETREELGVEVVLEPIGKLGSGPETAWEFVSVFRGRHDGPFRLARLEVETGAFFDVGQVERWLADRPGVFSPLFRLIFPRFVACVGDDSGYE